MNDESRGTSRVVTALERLGIEHEIVRTAPARSAEESARLQGIELSQLLKTIVVRFSDDDHVFVLVPGDRELSWKKLRRQLEVSRASLPPREEAERLTGFRIGTITPFGSLAELPVLLDAAALEHERVAIGAGESGVNVHLASSQLEARSAATIADVTSLRQPG